VHACLKWSISSVHSPFSPLISGQRASELRGARRETFSSCISLERGGEKRKRAVRKRRGICFSWQANRAEILDIQS